MAKNNHISASGNSTSGDHRLKEEVLTPTTSASTPHRIFSVDDDPKEIQNDIRYLEGLHEGLKFALHANKSKRSVSSQPPRAPTTLAAHTRVAILQVALCARLKYSYSQLSETNAFIYPGITS